MKNKALFIDRDGVINKKALEHDYIKSPDEFFLLDEVVPIIHEYRNKGYLVVVVTNQRGLSLGVMNENDLQKIHEKMKILLSKNNIEVDAIYYCGHGIEDNCDCRKPRHGMLLKAAKELNIDLNDSIMIGDSLTDIECGKNAGCKKNILFTIEGGKVLLKEVK